MFDALCAIAKLVILAFQFAFKRGSNNFIVPKLFKRGNSKLNEQFKMSEEQPGKRLNLIRSLEPFQINRPKILCFRKNKESRMFNKAVSRTEKEMDIVRFIRM